MDIVVTGENGRLGKHLVDHHGCVPFGWMSTNESAIRRRIYELGHPDVIIHCAAVTDVDRCEGELFDEALMTNWYRTRALRRMYSGRIIYVSTDYVFDGESGPYKEYFPKPRPINHYGYTKLCGERIVRNTHSEHCIVRTTQLFGGEKEDFVSRIIDNLRNENAVAYSIRLYGSPTFVPDLSTALMELAGMNYNDISVVLNIAGNRVVSRYDFAVMVAKELELDSNLIIKNGSSFVGIARRPLLAGLITDKAKELGITIRDPLLGVMEKYA